jgi:hypothetical protein
VVLYGYAKQDGQCNSMDVFSMPARVAVKKDCSSDHLPALQERILEPTENKNAPHPVVTPNVALTIENLRRIHHGYLESYHALNSSKTVFSFHPTDAGVVLPVCLGSGYHKACRRIAGRP